MKGAFPEISILKNKGGGEPFLFTTPLFYSIVLATSNNTFSVLHLLSDRPLTPRQPAAATEIVPAWTSMKTKAWIGIQRDYDISILHNLGRIMLVIVELQRPPYKYHSTNSDPS